MKTFTQFMNEVYDPDVQGRSQIRKQGEGGRVGSNRKKTTPEIRRTKNVGGGDIQPTQYRDRKDIGAQKPTEKREQQPTQERGSAGVSGKEAQRKAYRERKSRESGAKTKTASQLLTKKAPQKSAHPDYKPKTGGAKYSRKERLSVQGKGERALRDIFRGQEKDKGADKKTAAKRASERMSK